jgi:hypothetical protein
VKEGMRGQNRIKLLLNKGESLCEKPGILPHETIEGLVGLCEILNKIRFRIIQEGYIIKEGKVYSPNGILIYEKR